MFSLALIAISMAFAGPSISFASFYLGHVTLALWIIVATFSLRLRNSEYVGYYITAFTPIILIFIYYYWSFLWVEDLAFWARKSAFLLIGLAIMVMTFVACCKSFIKLKIIVGALIGLVALQIIVAGLEGMGVLRLPTSPYSDWAPLLGKRAVDWNIYPPDVESRVRRWPTGFTGNPNDLSAILVLFSGFFLFHRIKIVSVFGILSIALVIYAAESRIAGIGLAVSIMFYIVVRLRCMGYKYSFLLAITTILLLLATLISIILNIGLISDLYRIFYVTITRGSEIVAEAWRFVTSPDVQLTNYGRDSIGSRWGLTRNGLIAIFSTYGVGVGAGNIVPFQEYISGPGGVNGSVDLHNFWLEIFSEGGIVCGALFFYWYFAQLFGHLKIINHSENKFLVYLSKSIACGLLGYVLSCIGPSSSMYILPMWILFGVSLATLYFGKRES